MEQTLRARAGRVRGGPVGRGQTKVALNPRGDSEDSEQPQVDGTPTITATGHHARRYCITRR